MKEYGLYYDMLGDLSNLFQQLLMGMGIALFYTLFFNSRKRAWMVGMIYTIVVELLYYVPVSMSGMLAYALSSCASLAVMLLLRRDRKNSAVFVAVTFFILRRASSFLVGVLAVPIWEIVQEWVLKRNMDANGMVYVDEVMFPFWCAREVLEWLFMAVLLFLMVWGICKVFVCREEEIDGRELGVLLTPSLLGVLCYGIYVYYLEVLEKEENVAIYDYYGAQVLWGILWLAIVAAVFVVTALESRSRKQQEELYLQQMFQMQVEEVKRDIARIEESHSRLRGLRHDMRNHFTVLSKLISQGDMEAAKKYLDTFGVAAGIESRRICEEGILEDAEEICTGHPVTDVILMERERMAAKQGIRFSAEFVYPQGTRLDVFDVSVILNNALDNAFWAARECPDGIVDIRTFRDKNLYLITVTNSVREAGKDPVQVKDGTQDGDGTRGENRRQDRDGTQGGNRTQGGDKVQGENRRQDRDRTRGGNRTQGGDRAQDGNRTQGRDRTRGRNGMQAEDRTQPEETLHGFGLKNIQAAAKKYNGDFSLMEQGGTVTLQVLLMLA